MWSLPKVRSNSFPVLGVEILALHSAVRIAALGPHLQLTAGKYRSEEWPARDIESLVVLRWRLAAAESSSIAAIATIAVGGRAYWCRIRALLVRARLIRVMAPLVRVVLERGAHWRHRRPYL